MQNKPGARLGPAASVASGKDLDVARIPAFSSPFMLGFDGLERLLERLAGGDGYPPCNIERLSGSGAGDVLRITLAVAGFADDELDVTVEGNQLTVRGRQKDASVRDYLYRGIAARQFQKSFVLADGIEVESASLADGLLSINLVRPDGARQARKITIGGRA